MQESIREIEETLNQQLFNIGMNLGLPRQIDETNTSSLNNSREQPVLNIIYEHNKTLESSGNTIFMSQFDSFDMNQITLQVNAFSIYIETISNVVLEPIYIHIKKYYNKVLIFYKYKMSNNQFSPDG